MSAGSFILSIIVLHGAAPLETKFRQIAPIQRETPSFERSTEQHRAVVLVHGFRIHPFKTDRIAEAQYQKWQQCDSTLTCALAKEADVYAFAYAQTAAVETIAEAPGFGDNIAKLKQLGYAEIVLVGHSAGGLIARQFVEDHPNAGVTKVIQVCAPNAGTSWGKSKLLVRQRQEVFLDSLTKKHRQAVLENRVGKKIPAKVEFVCLVCRINLPESLGVAIDFDGEAELSIAVDTTGLRGDGVVSCKSQWSKELREQGIPVLAVEEKHFAVMKNEAAVAKLAELVRQKQSRWDAAAVSKAESKILGETAFER